MSEENTVPEAEVPETTAATPVVQAAPEEPKPAPKPRAKKKDPNKKKPYTVIKGSIFPDGGHSRDAIKPGDTAMLTDSLAKHYARLGFLAPVIDED